MRNAGYGNYYQVKPNRKTTLPLRPNDDKYIYNMCKVITTAF